MATAASSGLEAAPSENTSSESRSPQEIAVPPIIREAPIDLQNALPDDFVVSRQTPYSSGRNEVLIVSPSTGTEQRFEINLPGASGSFRLYQASFDKVVIDDPARVVGDESLLSSDQVQTKLESFTINFDSNNLLASVILADGAKAEFLGSEAIIRSADGQVIETIALSSALPNLNPSALVKSRATNIAQASTDCETRVTNKTFASGQDAGKKSDALKNAQSDEGKMSAWVLTFGKRALEDSMVATRRNQTLQEVACKPPVRCDEPRSYNGSNETRTELFQLSGGTNQQITINYEFYDIPDRMEIYYEGNQIKSIPEGAGFTNGGSDENPIPPIDIPDGVEFLGIKLIGNENPSTLWDYTISCSGEQDGPLGIDRWWATAGSEDISVAWTVEVEQKSEYIIRLNFEKDAWGLSQNATLTIDGVNSFSFNSSDSVSVGELLAGKHKLLINYFNVPAEPIVEEVRFSLLKKTSRGGRPYQTINTLFISDLEPYRGIDSESLARQYLPSIYFDNGEIGGSGELYTVPIGISSTWGKAFSKDENLLNGSLENNFSIPTSQAIGDNREGKVYAAIVESSNEVAINYYFHYQNSNWKDYGGYNNHSGDWEGITVFLKKTSAGLSANRVAFSQHVSVFGFSGAQTVLWEAVDKENSTHPKVYVGLGGHASYPFRGITGWSDPGSAGIGTNLEFHKGDFPTVFQASPDQVVVLPRVGDIEKDELKTSEQAWLLYPGKWGGDSTSPRGPIFQEVDYDFGFDDGNAGLRWLNPWKWSEDFSVIGKGRNNPSIQIEQIIYIGDSDANNVTANEDRSILRGGLGNDVYRLLIEGTQDSQFGSGSFIEDEGGDKDELRITTLEPVDIDINVTGGDIFNHNLTLSLPSSHKSVYGIYKEGQTLIVDLDGDGRPEYADDLSIFDFFNSNGGKGSGFIEKVQNLTGDEIMDFFQSQ